VANDPLGAAEQAATSAVTSAATKAATGAVTGKPVDVSGTVSSTATSAADKAINGAINGEINSEIGKIIAVPDAIKQVGSTALTLATEVGNIVSSGSALLSVATSGNMGFLTVPALGALTVAQIAALKNIGSQLDSHGQALGGAAQSYATTEQTITKTAATQLANNEGLMGSNSTLLATVQADSSTATRQVGSLSANAGGAGGAVGPDTKEV
jgi:hypothetical protein